MLLEGVTVDRIFEVISEVRVEIEERSAEEGVGAESISVVEGSAVVAGEGAQFDTASVGVVEGCEAVELAGGDEVERELAGGVEVVASEDKAEARLSLRASWRV